MRGESNHSRPTTHYLPFLAAAEVALLEKLPFGTCPPFAFAVVLWMRLAAELVIFAVPDPLEDDLDDMKLSFPVGCR